MIKLKLSKAILGILGAAAMSSVAAQASANPTVAFDGGAAGSSASVSAGGTLTSWSFAFGQNLGWNHTSGYHDLIVTGSGGTVTITDTQSATTDALPGFSVWLKDSGAASGHINGNHQYDQVAGTSSPTNSFMIGSVQAFVGYGNAGATFTNANGEAVGHGGVGSGFSGSTTTGATTGGLEYVTLTLTGLAAGDYYFLTGGSDYNGTSGKTTTGDVLTASVNAVPVPGAVWLFGSAISGFIGLSRRKSRA